MQTLREIIQEAESKKVAIGHFNISDLVGLRAILKSAQSLSAEGYQVPIIIGLSEGEREFVGTHMAAVMVRTLREDLQYPIYINADHTRSLEKVKEAVAAGFDAILFDAGQLPLDENIAKAKEVVQYIKSVDPDILVEGELGYIGTSSEIMEAAPEGAAITLETITKPEDAKRFVTETGMDLLGPAVGNIHGMFAHAPNPHLFIDRIKEIKDAVGIPLVLHGGSGTPDEDFIKAIDAGISIVHINTEIRKAWRQGLEAGLAEHPTQVTPYKLLAGAEAEITKVVTARLRLFNKQ